MLTQPYSAEGKDADDTAVELVKFVERVISADVPLRFVAHSLGSCVVMETASKLLDLGYVINQVCLMAAAIDDYSLASPDDYVKAVESTKRVAVLSSKKDKVLKYAYPAGDLLQAFIFFKRDEIGLALGYHGPKPFRSAKSPVPQNVLHFPIPENRKVDHDDYIPDGEPTVKQISAASFADDVISGKDNPVYP